MVGRQFSFTEVTQREPVLSMCQAHSEAWYSDTGPNTGSVLTVPLGLIPPTYLSK